MTTKTKKQSINQIAKCPTGIKGVDEITEGGLPKDRVTLLSGSAGCGKTLFSAEFLLHGAIDYNEAGLFLSFEEAETDLVKNISSIGYDVNKLIKQKKITFHHVYIDRNEFVEAGGYNLDGLFIQIEHLVKTLNIKRIILDTIEVLFSQLKDEMIIRSELQRLFQWISSKKLTAIVTAETGGNFLSRHGLEEYVADCVILLDNRIVNQLSTRRLRIIKYRGSNHGSNEYPFVIGSKGFVVLPITSLKLDWVASPKHISTGIKRLDTMLGGKGYFVGSSVLISGMAGTGKSSFACAFADTVCSKGQRCLYISFEESVSQIIRNMKSIDLDVEPWIKKNLLEIHSVQPFSHALENHLVILYDLIETYKPSALIIDPVNNLEDISEPGQVKALLSRLFNYARHKQITVISTYLLTSIAQRQYRTNISSIMDTWILLQNLENNGEQNRTLSILKSRGMKHSDQMREIIITDKGVDLVNVYMGEGKVLTGSARIQKEAQEAVDKTIASDELKYIHQENLSKLKLIKSQILALEAEFDRTYNEIQKTDNEKVFLETLNKKAYHALGERRMIDADTSLKKSKQKTRSKRS